MRRFSLVLAVALLTAPSVMTMPAWPRQDTRPAAKTAVSGRFELTVDSIMRGPDLVGFPPSGLRWSADSQSLYFDWRKPGEKEASTYMVRRDGGGPRKLSDDEIRTIPAVNGRWDKARRRVLFVDDGDIVIVDSSGARRQITRTTGGESNPRWARSDTHITYVRDGNLFILPIDAAAAAIVTQLTDVAAKKTEPKLTDSQKFIRDEEARLIDHVREEREQKKKDEEKAKKNKPPSFELQDRQTAADLMLSPDNTHVFIVVGERPAGARTAIVPNYVTDTGYIEDIPARAKVGDSQDRRLLAVLNLETGKSVWADSSFAPPTSRRSVWCIRTAPGRPRSSSPPTRRRPRRSGLRGRRPPNGRRSTGSTRR